MTTEQAASGPNTGPYEVIHLGGQAAVVVPVAMLQWKARDAAGQTTFVPADKARRRLGLPR